MKAKTVSSKRMRKNRKRIPENPKLPRRGIWGGTLRLNPQRGDFGPESQTTMPRHKVNAINTRRRHIAGIMYYV